MPDFKDEFKFPDEIESKTQDDDSDFDVQVEIEDDTPPEDRGKKPLPKPIVEEIEQDELAEYSEKAKERLLQFRKVWHDERREKDAALREQAEAIRVAEKLLEENRLLKQSLKSGEEVYISTIKTSAEKDLNEAKREYRDALDSGDPDRIVEMQHKLTNASINLEKTKNFKPTVQNVENDVQLPKVNTQTQQSEPDEKFVKWQRSNSSWFNKDKEMTAAAMGLHEKLGEQYGPEYIGTDDYYATIDKTIRRRFPEAFPDADKEASEPQKAQKTKPSTVVASAKRSTAPKSITLTATQAALAKKFKLTPEQYAREVLKLRSN